MTRNKLPSTLVAVDLETTGVNANDKIIEVGAVRFDLNGEMIEKYRSLINPHAKLSPFIIDLTGIAQSDVDAAPDIADIHADLERFIGDYPLVAHNAAFDVRFLRDNGWRIANSVYDTLELAQTLIPNAEAYRLNDLAQFLGLRPLEAHRALDDAEVAARIFVELVKILRRQPDEIKTIYTHLDNLREWTPGALAALALDEAKASKNKLAHVNKIISKVESNAAFEHEPTEQQSKLGLDANSYIEMVDAVFKPDGVLSQVMENFNYRDSQAQLARKVAEMILNGKNLIAEAGTGIGKSLAYLIPATIYAIGFNCKTVISTHTINLQEQLMKKDIEIVRATLRRLGLSADLNVAILKGRANYLCYRHWRYSVLNPPTAKSDITLLGKSMLWLTESQTGDREEVNLSSQSRAFYDYSADKNLCKMSNQPCFLYKARQQANAADIVITNHHLLLSDMLGESGLLPKYDALIIDEAHNIVDVATSVQTFGYGAREVATFLEQALNLMADLANKNNNARAAEEFKQTRAGLKSATHPTARFFADLARFLQNNANADSYQIRIKQNIRERAEWNDVRVGWNNLKLTLSKIGEMATNLISSVKQPEPADGEEDDGALGRLQRELKRLEQTARDLDSAVAAPRDNFVYWAERSSFGDSDGVEYTLKGAPIDVSRILGDKLFAPSVGNIMIGATLSYENSLERFVNELGVEAHATEILETDFDYSRNVASLFVADMPSPNSEEFIPKLAEAARSVFKGVNGRVLVLFTSRAKMNKTANIFKSLVNQDNVKFVVQGRDGRPSQIQNALIKNERIIAFGMSSMWEGMDIEGGGLDATVVSHLPFPVPSEPINEARAELRRDGFLDYFVPEAVKRFRQGFGRLIRSNEDSGIFIVLDSRVLTRGYGRQFLGSLPNCPRKRISAEQLEDYTRLTRAQFSGRD